MIRNIKVIVCVLFLLSSSVKGAASSSLIVTSESDSLRIEPQLLEPIIPKNLLSPKGLLRLELESQFGAEYTNKLLFKEFDNLDTESEDVYHLLMEEDVLDPNLHEVPFLNDTTVQYRERAFELLEFVETKNRFVDQLDENTILDLPVGISKTIGNIKYTILIDSMIMLPTHSYLTAYMAFEVPSSGKKLAFRGSNIQFSQKGGISGNARLELVGDHSMNLGPKSLLILKGQGKTYVEWDCFGFKSMGLDAEIEFSKDIFLTDNANGAPGEDRVKASFTTSLSSWDDLIVEVNMTPFQVKGLNGVGFTVKKAVLDYSMIRAAPGVVFPKDYENSAYDSSEPAFWQGFFLSELSVRLPKQFQKNGSSDRFSFSAYNVIIDDMGFSGTLEAKNVIGSDGRMDKWPFTVNSLSVTLVANHIKGAGFEGLLTIPVDKENPLEYKAIINPGDEYIFAVSPSKDMNFEFLQTSEIEIAESSYLEVKVKDGKFLPKAVLNGKLSIAAGKANLKSLSFEQLQIQTVEPYVKLGGFALGGFNIEQKLGSFTIGIDNIGLANMDDPNEVAVRFDITVKLIGEDDGGFGGEAGLIVVGTVNDAGKDLQYDRLDITKIGISFNAGAVAVEGSLEWFKNDNVYGDGIRGEAKVNVIDKIEVQAVVLFGKKGDLRFWFFDALAELPPGVGTGIAVKSFGGGAYYHMKQASSGGNGLGQALSGITYVPDQQTYFGIKATVTLATAGSEKVFNGDATLEISFNQGGGIRMIDFKGNGYFMTPALGFDLAGLKAKAGGMVAGAAETALDFAKPKASVSAHIHINYDAPNKTLHGTFDVFINVAGGLVKGIGANNRAGWAVMHFSPDEWYIHIGSPDDPIGLEIIKILRTESYFMVGDNIPGSPPPPPEVSEILGGMDLDYMSDLNSLGSGKGLAFGTRVSFDTGNIQFMMFYARFKAGIGFDVMVKDYGNASCVGSDGPIGINGWYANGQAFAYFEGTCGISVKLFGKRKKVEILSLGAAVVLQAKLPNPFWMRGVVGGRYDVLGGLIKGNCKFQVTIGKECEIEGGSVLEGVQVIAEVTPTEGASDVSVFNASQGVFNMEINKVFEMVDIDDVKKAFRIKLDHFKLTEGAYEIPGTLEWNYEGDVLAFNPIDILPQNKSIKAAVQVSFEQFENGSWEEVKTTQGEVYRERKEISFQTGEAPDHIPAENVTYSYPVANQYNFYKDESRKGYIKLNRGQPELFEVSNDWIQKGRFRSVDGETRYFDIAYNSQQVNFTVPSNMTVNKIYAFELVNLPAGAAAAVDSNVTEETSAVALDSDIDSLSLEITSNNAEGNINILQEKLIYDANFKTSNFSKFSDKVTSLSISNGWSWPIMTGIHELGVNVSGTEMFDEFEVNYQENFGPLVEFEAVLTNNAWYQNTVKSLIYPSYPPSGLTLDWRDPEPVEVLGVPPVRAVYIAQDNEPYILTEDEVNSNSSKNTNGLGSFVYNLPYTVFRDYANFRQKAAEKISVGLGDTWMKKIISTQYPGILSGDYKMILRYRMPGTREITSEKMINIYVD